MGFVAMLGASSEAAEWRWWTTKGSTEPKSSKVQKQLGHLGYTTYLYPYATVGVWCCLCLKMLGAVKVFRVFKQTRHCRERTSASMTVWHDRNYLAIRREFYLTNYTRQKTAVAYGALVPICADVNALARPLQMPWLRLWRSKIFRVRSFHW